MSSTVFSKLTAVVKLVAAICAGGLVLAAMLFPVLGGAGAATKTASQLVQDVDTEFNAAEPALISRVRAADDSPLVYYYNYYRLPTTLDKMGEWAPKAIVAIEDRRFYQHNGVDLEGMFRALVKNTISGDTDEGASTLTQQLVKNVLFYQATTQKERDEATESSYARKLREAKIAVNLEKTISKDEILERYLNLMNMGGGAYGIRAASKMYFGIEPADLSIAQAAMIAGIVQSPTQWDPLNNPQATKERRDLVIDAMADTNAITADQATEAKKKPLGLKDGGGAKPNRACAEAPKNGGFYCDYVTTYLTKNLGIPEKVLKEGGLTIKTSLQPSYQNAATNAILSAAPVLYQDPSTFGLSDTRLATMPIMDPKTGQVQALAVNKKYGNDPNDPTQTVNNYPILPNGDGAGSTYKLFTSIAALREGTGINFQLNAPPPYTSKIMAAMGIDYSVENATSGYPSRMPLWQALYMSSNTYFVALEDYLGSITPVVEAAQDTGLWAPGDTEIADTIKAEQRASFTLGPESTSPLRLATAYATIANSGTRCEPTPIVSITGPDGKPAINPETKKPWYTPDTNCTKDAVSPGIANTINQILLKDVMPGNSGQTGANAYVPGYQIAGKTGTAETNRAYSFVGYTPDIVAAVLAFDPTNNNPLPGSGGEQGFGGGFPATIWRLAMEQILPSVGVSDFPPGDPEVEAVKSTTMSVNCVGQSPSNCQAMAQNAGFFAVDSGSPVDSTLPAGVVASQSPAPGSTVPLSATITYSVSSGNAPAGQPCQPGQDPKTGCKSDKEDEEKQDEEKQDEEKDEDKPSDAKPSDDKPPSNSSSNNNNDNEDDN
ncbi:MAG: penicillin-binding protein [Cumulibacter sp.]